MTAPATATPRHALTDEALRLLLHAETRLPLPPATPVGAASARLGAARLGGLTEGELRVQAAFFRLVSVTEAYLDALSMQELQRAQPFTGQPLQTMLTEHEITATANWRSRTQNYKDYHGVRLGPLPGHTSVMAAVQVRNAIAHGLGRLTARQRGNADLATQVARLDVSIGSGRMHLAGTTLALTHVACADLIKAVDVAVP